MVNFTIKQLLENGVHYGHHTRRWNPKMASYIYGTYNNIHIIDLQQTAPMFSLALEQIKKIVAADGRVLFVGTKTQASSIIKESAERCGQYYVHHRWLGGMLTNWKTISNSIIKLNELDKKITEGMIGLTKKERLDLTRQRDKLQLILGGIRGMAGLPDIIFVLDSSKEFIVVEEARKLKIPLVAIVDTNSNPELIDYPIPGNDDAIKSIRMYCDLISQAVLEGLKEAVINEKEDIGSSEDIDILTTANVSEKSKVAKTTKTDKITKTTKTEKIKAVVPEKLVKVTKAKEVHTIKNNNDKKAKKTV